MSGHIFHCQKCLLTYYSPPNPLTDEGSAALSTFRSHLTPDGQGRCLNQGEYEQQMAAVGGGDFGSRPSVYVMWPK